MELVILHKFSCGICVELAHDFPLLSTPDEAFVHATEINKPYYYYIFGAGYEVCYLDCNSREWTELYRDMEQCQPLLDLIIHNRTYKPPVPRWFNRFFYALFPNASRWLP